MPRSRNIKPSIFKNELLGEGDPLLTILFEGLWCLADREGRLEDRPKRIKAEIFPYRELPDFNGYLTVLEQLGFIHRYTIENQPYIHVVNFAKHQSPHKTEKQSVIPKPPKKSASCPVTDNAPLNNEKVNVKESLIPDSGSLIPDLLNPDSLTADSGSLINSEKEPSNKKQATEAAKALRKEIWESYKKAYFDRYATEPVGNAKVYTAIKQIHERIGEEAKHVAAFYVTINDQFLIKQSHALGPLLSNCEGFTTQWRRGQAITSTVARQTDQSQSNFDAAKQVCAEIDRENGNAN